MPHRDLDKSFKRMNALVGFIGVLVVCFWLAVGYFAIALLHDISEHGLKSVLTEVWEGKPKS